MAGFQEVLTVSLPHHRRRKLQCQESLNLRVQDALEHKTCALCPKSFGHGRIKMQEMSRAQEMSRSLTDSLERVSMVFSVGDWSW